MSYKSQLNKATSAQSASPIETNLPNSIGDLAVPPTAMKRRAAVSQMTGKGKSALYADIAQGLFTPPVPIGVRTVAWPEYEIMAINAARIAGLSNDEIRKLVATLVAARKSARSEG